MVSESKAVREILFRGKRVGNGEIVEGFYIFDGFNHYIVKFYTDENAEGTLYPVQEAFEVIPETVGQFTGLTDKNGTKIFEGDICTFDDEMMVVEWYDEDAMFFLLSLDGTNWTTNFSMVSGKELEAIGNIYDNPELQEGCDG